VHEETTAAEILKQCPDVKAFVAGAGTGGTITGVARVLRPRGVRIVLADPVGSLYADLVDAQKSPDLAYAVEGIGGSERPNNLDPSLIDAVERVTDAESFETARALIRGEGLLVGGSAGTNVAAAMRVQQRTGGPVVTVLPDSWDRYASQPWLK
jgi:cysteine synthase